MSNSGSGEHWMGFFKDGVVYGSKGATEYPAPEPEMEDEEAEDEDS